MSEFNIGSQEFDASRRELIGEPLRRPDGCTVSIYRYPSGAIDAIVKGAIARYPHEQVLAIGEGDEMLGAIRIGRAVFQDENVVIGQGAPMKAGLRQGFEE